MNWFCILLALLLVPALPCPVDAQVKSILRFERDTKARESEESTGDADQADAASRAPSQGSAGSTRQGTLVQEGEGGDETEGDVPLIQGEAAAAGLPGTPATLAPPDPNAPAALNAPPASGPPPLAPAADAGRRAIRPPGAVPQRRMDATEGISPGREAPRPFVYERAPRDVGTATGYDAAVAPQTILVDPSTPPPLTEPGAAQRPLPRLAPYGSALPPGAGTPPASRPR